MATNYQGGGRGREIVNPTTTITVTVNVPQANEVDSYWDLPGTEADKAVYFTTDDQMYWIFDLASGRWLPARSVIYNNYGGIKDEGIANVLTGVMINGTKDEVAGAPLEGVMVDGQLDP